DVLRQIAFEEPVPLRRLDRRGPPGPGGIALQGAGREPTERHPPAPGAAPAPRRPPARPPRPGARATPPPPVPHGGPGGPRRGAGGGGGGARGGGRPGREHGTRLG